MLLSDVAAELNVSDSQVYQYRSPNAATAAAKRRSVDPGDAIEGWTTWSSQRLVLASGSLYLSFTYINSLTPARDDERAA